MALEKQYIKKQPQAKKELDCQTNKENPKKKLKFTSETERHQEETSDCNLGHEFSNIEEEGEKKHKPKEILSNLGENDRIMVNDFVLVKSCKNICIFFR